MSYEKTSKKKETIKKSKNKKKFKPNNKQRIS